MASNGPRSVADRIASTVLLDRRQRHRGGRCRSRRSSGRDRPPIVPAQASRHPSRPTGRHRRGRRRLGQRDLGGLGGLTPVATQQPMSAAPRPSASSIGWQPLPGDCTRHGADRQARRPCRRRGCRPGDRQPERRRVGHAHDRPARHDATPHGTIQTGPGSRAGGDWGRVRHDSTIPAPRDPSRSAPADRPSRTAGRSAPRCDIDGPRPGPIVSSSRSIEIGDPLSERRRASAEVNDSRRPTIR